MCLGPRPLKRGTACLALASLKVLDEANPASVLEKLEARFNYCRCLGKVMQERP